MNKAKKKLQFVTALDYGEYSLFIADISLEQL